MKKILLLLCFLQPFQLFALTLHDLEGRWDLEPIRQSMYDGLLTGQTKTDQDAISGALEKDPTSLQNLKSVELIQTGSVIFDKVGNSLWTNSLVVLVKVKEYPNGLPAAVGAWSTTSKVTILNGTFSETQLNCTSQIIPFLDTIITQLGKNFDTEAIKSMLQLFMMPQCEFNNLIGESGKDTSEKLNIVSYDSKKIVLEDPETKIKSVLVRRKI